MRWKLGRRTQGWALCVCVGAALTVGLGVLVAGAAARRSTRPHGVTLSTRQVISALAAEGVGVYMSPASSKPVDPVTAPAVPIRVLYPQAVLFADQTKEHSGTLGSSLNQLMPMPKAPAGHVYPGFDYLMAAYAQSTATPGEVLAGKLLRQFDLTHPDTVVFPDLIGTLLSADALRAAPANGAAPDRPGSVGTAHAAGAGSACSAISDWLSSAYNSVFNALTVGPSSNAAVSFIGGLWDRAVSLAQSAISNIADVLTGPVIGAIRTGLATAGVVSWAISTFRNLQVQVKADPSSNEFGVDPADGHTGKVTITVGKPGGWEWPSGITACANLFKVDLPSVNSVVGRTVQWKLIDDNSVPTSSWCKAGHSCYLAKQESADGSLQSDHTATLEYRTNTETQFQHTHGTPINTDSILVSGTVPFNTDQLANLIKKVLLGAVPGAVKVVVGPLFDALTGVLQKQLAKLSQPKFFRYVLIAHHGNAVLAQRSCSSLEPEMYANFPDPPEPGAWAPDLATEKGIDGGAGATDATACTVTTFVQCPSSMSDMCTDGYHCSATVNCQPLGAWDLLYYATDTDATNGYDAIRKEGIMVNSTPVGGIGDEAATTGGGGVVRVENAVFLFFWLPHWSDDPAPTKVLQAAVGQICPDCSSG